jgi:aminomuconate-semialdehyde/2-hydroxymuconate-6-semialdehyde dehydrogenase
MSTPSSHRRLLNVIAGECVPPRQGAFLPNVNPATGEVIGELPASTAADVDSAVEAARAAFPAWRDTPRARRAEILTAAADALAARREEFALAETRDQGKPLSLARSMDVPRAIENFRFFAGAIVHEENAAFHSDGPLLNYTTRAPVGVAALVTPWNLPLYLLTWKLAPALATGNVAVCKPSEYTSTTAFLLSEVLRAAGLPPGVCNMVFGDGTGAGEPLVSHPGVGLVSFTGGTATGERVARAAAPAFKKLSLELGGKNANVVFADADVDLAARTAVRAAFLNQGEICLCGSRLYVEASIFDDFLMRFKAETAKLVIGDPEHERTTLGALVSAEHRAKVEGYLSLAREEGARFVFGGGRPALASPFSSGCFLEPTILTGVREDSRLQKEEIFGPVVTVTPFHTEAEAVRFANDVPGLCHEADQTAYQRNSLMMRG